MENKYHFNLIAEAIKFLSKEYATQPNLEEVANHVHLSQFHFQRLFQKWVGISPKQFLQFTTVQHAKKCLEAGRSTLDAAYEVGLSGNGRLHDAFIKINACTPGEFKKRGRDLFIQYDIVDSSFGSALIAETDIGICKISFVKANEAADFELKSDFPEAIFKKQLGRYGTLVKQYFSTWNQPKEAIVLDLKGTPFQLQVWQALLQIPPAQLVSYQDIAKKIARPKANRAVGTAIGKNPIAYLIPCHRVIKSSGEMGNYRWAPERKLAINGYEAGCLSN